MAKCAVIDGVVESSLCPQASLQNAILIGMTIAYCQLTFVKSLLQKLINSHSRDYAFNETVSLSDNPQVDGQDKQCIASG